MSEQEEKPKVQVGVTDDADPGAFFAAEFSWRGGKPISISFTRRASALAALGVAVATAGTQIALGGSWVYALKQALGAVLVAGFAVFALSHLVGTIVLVLKPPAEAMTQRRILGPRGFAIAAAVGYVVVVGVPLLVLTWVLRWLG